MRLPIIAMLVVTSCSAWRKDAPAQRAAPDTFPSIVRDWAPPTPFTFRGQVDCEVDGGATVSSIAHRDAWLTPEGDCEVSQLTCPTAAARSEVLRALDAGTLRFPEQRVLKGLNGYFEIETDSDSLLRVECGAEATRVSAGFPTLQHWILQPRGGRREFPAGAQRVLLVNPFTRSVRRLSEAEWNAAPNALLDGAWLTEEPEGLLRSSGDEFGKGAVEPAPPPEDAGVLAVLAVRVRAPEGLRPEELGLWLKRPSTEETEETVVNLGTRANGADLAVAPGDYVLNVHMDGSQTVVRPVTVSSPRTEVLVTLEPAVGSRGRVVDARGKPVEAACVTAREEGKWYRCATFSDRHGEFALRPGEAPRALRARHPSLGSTELTVTDSTPVVLRLEAQNRLELSIRLPDGTFGWGSVSLTPLGRVPVNGRLVELTNLPAGPNEVRVDVDGFWAPPLEVTMPELGTVEREVLLQPLGTLTGVVLRKGRPLVKFGVWAKEPIGELTDENGRFQIRKLPHGRLELKFGDVSRYPNPERTLRLPVPGNVEIELTTGSVRELPLDGP